MMSKKYKIGNHNIYLPDNHKLDQYQQTWKLYDRMLGMIAHYVLIKYPQTTAIDIGANVGDTAALIQEFQPIYTLCIEGNPEYLPYLQQNAKIIGNIEIANYFIGKDGETVDLNNISSKGGTTSIVKAIGAKGNNTSIMQSLASLLKNFSKFQNSKILKIDTDGFDFEIIVNSQNIIQQLKPIIYFEYDISFDIKNNGVSKALNTVNFLSNLGYQKFMFFDNFGNHLCSISSDDKNYFFDLTNYLFSNLYKSGQPAVYYFDICAFHKYDLDIFENVYSYINQDISTLSDFLNNFPVNDSAKKMKIEQENQNNTEIFVSYAQNFEDVLLNRVFTYKMKGFYIDIGALHPTFDSVTKAFYDRGWSGINIEPIRDFYNVFTQERNRDTNLNIAVSDSSGELEFFQVVGQPGNSTLNKEIAYQVAKEKGLEVSQYKISVKTLKEICQEYVKQKIDFLKIDVEGLEENVILGGDWENFRPTILVIETTLPNTNIRCENNILSILKEKGYQHVFFDGINDYYIAEESQELAKHFAYPVNVLDFYVDYRILQKNQQIQYLNKVLKDNNISISAPNTQNQNNQPVNISEPKSPIILIDGVFFQLYKTGIARVWKSLLEQWANTDFANHILVLDRANSAPKINGIRYRTIQPYDYNNTEVDKRMLQQICDEEGAELFISSYYTTPINTPSVFMAYDMIPEVIGTNLNEPMWQEKHKGINHASAVIAISENTAKDINKFFPQIPLESITVAHCGVSPLFSPATANEINSFKSKYGINKPYFLLGGLGGYKNAILFFQAFSQLANKTGFDIVATGAGSQLPSEWRQFTTGCTFHGLQLSDEELRLAYGGAVALVYPSKYEGFGMPVIEAMACGCPVITTPNASLPEAGGNAVIYVNADDIEGMANALCDLQKTSLRYNLIQAGLQQAQKFSWATMAEIVKKALFNAISPQIKLTNTNYLIFPDWQTEEEELTGELYNLISNLVNNAPLLEREELEVKDSRGGEVITLVIDTTGITEENANLILSGIVMNLMIEEELDLENTLDFALISKLNQQQWNNLLAKITAKINLKNENQDAIKQVDVESFVSIDARGNNYVIFPDWKTEPEQLVITISNVLKKIINLGTDKTTFLVNVSNYDIEEIALFFSELAMNLMLEENIDLSENVNLGFADFTIAQWYSLSSLIKAKINIEYENIPEDLMIIFDNISELKLN